MTVPVLMCIENRALFSPKERYEDLCEALTAITTYSEYVRTRLDKLLKGESTTLSEADRPILQRHALALPPEGLLLDELMKQLREYANLSPETMLSEPVLREIYRIAIRAFQITHPNYPGRERELFQSRVG